MSNYKPYGHQSVNIGVWHRSYSDGVNIKHLVYVMQGGGAPKSLFDSSNYGAGAYSVPTGKKLTILGYTFISNASQSTILIYEGATADAITTLKMALRSSTTTDEQIEIPTGEHTFTAGKYITADASTSGIEYITAIGIEVNA